jgi:hypothetical protein
MKKRETYKEPRVVPYLLNHQKQPTREWLYIDTYNTVLEAVHQIAAHTLI